MPKHIKRVVKTPTVNSKAFDLNKFIAPRVHKRASIWWPPTAWLKTKANHVDNLAKVFTVDPRLAAGQCKLADATGTVFSCVALNSPQPFDFIDNQADDNTYGEAIAPLDIMSTFYKRARVTSCDCSVRFFVNPASMALYTDATIQKGVLRIGCFLSKSAQANRAWSTDVDVGVPTSATVELRIAEAYRAGLLTTVPLSISNTPGDMYATAELEMRNINIMAQFQEVETTLTGPDPTNFSYALPRLNVVGVGHSSFIHPATTLFMHFFVIIDKPLVGFAGTVEDTSIDIQAEVSLTQNHLFSEPIGKSVEDSITQAT